MLALRPKPCQLIYIFTCKDDKSVLSVHMFVDSSIIPIDFPDDIVLSHVVRIHLCCWSLTADSHCLGWPGPVTQVVHVRSKI